MTGRHGPAARLAQIAHPQRAQMFAARARRQIAQVGQQRRETELAVPFRMRDHPAWTAQRQSRRTLHAARARLTDGARRARLGRHHATPAQVETSRRGLGGGRPNRQARRYRASARQPTRIGEG